MIFTMGVGYKYGTYAKDTADFRFLGKNFKLFPKEIQDAWMSSDSRYIRKYWKKDELNSTHV